MQNSYNKTQLYPERELGNHIFHRDQFAHMFRWTHVLKRVKKAGMNILDLGCANGNLFEVLWRNKRKPGFYLGVDIRSKMLDNAGDKFKKFDNCNFICDDLVVPAALVGRYEEVKNTPWDIITCFEVVEHVGKSNVPKLLQTIKYEMNKETVLLISTPCYNGTVAKNHVIDGEVGELTYDEMKKCLGEKFEIINHWGTFASQKEYEPYLTESQREVYDKLSEYYDINLLSNLMAPLVPEHSRNVLWECKLGKV